MTIWIDLTNSPHVLFFAEMIRELQQQHQIVVTSRPLANTIDLLRMEGIPYAQIGSHYGGSSLSKSLGFPTRILQLWWFLRRVKPDVAVSQSSFYSPVAARLLRVPSVYTNDNEHADGNKVAFTAATQILLPEFLGDYGMNLKPRIRAKTRYYPGVKEGIYLSGPRFTDRTRVAGGGRMRVVVRPEPDTAQYYRGGINFLDDCLADLARDCEVTILPRSEAQRRHYNQERFGGMCVKAESLSLAAIAQWCDLFIGAGGTMTREAAVLGVPTVSVYRGELLAVDQYLVRSGFMAHLPQPDASKLREVAARAALWTDRRFLLEKGRRAYAMLRESIVDRGGMPCA